MKQKTRRLIALLCVFCMLFTSMPVSVYADSMPATPTDLTPVTPEEAEQEEETESPEETGEPEISKPEADREVTGSDDITVTGSLEGNPPAEYLIRFYPETTQTLCLILTSDREMKTTVTDENTDNSKWLAFDHTDEAGQTVLILPYYKVHADSTYLIRISGKEPAEFSIRMVKKSILDAESATETPTEEPSETPSEEPAETPTAEPTEEPTATPEPVPVRISAVDSGMEVWIDFMSDAGIPQNAELRVRELSEEEQAAYTARTVRALECEDEFYLYYTKYLSITLVYNGEKVELNAPCTVSVNLADLREGAGAIQAVRFGERTAALLDSRMEDRVISFETDTLAVFGIGNALTPLTTQETDLASVEVLGFSPDAAVSLEETEAPEVEEGLEVLGSYIVNDQTEAAAGTEEQDGLWIKAELNENAELSPMESVSLYRVEDGQAEVLVEDLSEGSEITELDAQQVAVIKDTGYRHLTLTVNPDETTEDQIVTLDGMMPKDAEATVEEVTEQYTDCFAVDTADAEPAQEAETPDRVEETETTAEEAAVTSDETEPAGTRTTLAAYEISISHSEGEYQPDEDKPISVEIVDSRISADRNIELWHIRDDGTREQVMDFTVEEGWISFEAAGFSVYVVIDHEDVTDPADSTVKTPRVMFHFIDIDNATENAGVYIGQPYKFKNKHGEIQTTQILKDTESLELIVDPGNRSTQFFYGWYMVQPHMTGSANETDIEGVFSNGDLCFTWPANPKQIVFNSPISIREKDVAINATVNWTLNGVSGSGEVDSEGNVHVFLAPIFENYNFVDFMLYPRDSSGTGSGSETDPYSNNLMTRKMIVRGSADELEVKISDIRSNSTDPVYLIFTGWEYYDDNENKWIQVPTVDYSGAELKDKYTDEHGNTVERDGTYLDLDSTLIQGDSNLALYPIFIEARWMDFSSGKSGSGASYVASRFLESWGAATPPDTPKVDGKNVITSLDVPTRAGYEFEGWYAYAAVDEDTGEITNLNAAADINTKYINLDSKFNTIDATINTKAIKITEGDGDVVANLDDVTLNDGTVKLFGITNGQLQFYDALDRLKLTARWVPSKSQIHVIYWTEKAQEKGYTAPADPKDDYMSSAVKTITTEELNTYLQNSGSETRYYSGYTITREGLAAYKDGTVSILAAEYLDDLNAVPAGDEKFYKLDETLSDSSVVINGDGSTTINIYYSRLDFTLVFHIGRDGYVKKNGQQRNNNTASNWDGNWIQYMYCDEKTEELGYFKPNGATAESYPTRGTASPDFVFSMTYNGATYTSFYQTTKANVKGDYNPKDHNDSNLYWINAKYGAYIADKWPSPVNPNFTFTDPEGSERTMYIWAAYYGSLYCGISHARDPAGDSNNCNPDINGIYEYMSAELCSNRAGTGVINENRVHHLVAYYGQSGKEGLIKNYHFYFEAIPGVQIPEGAEYPVHGTDYLGYPQTTWSSLQGDADYIDGHDFYKNADAVVISERSPQVQIGPEFDGYDFLYSCYEVPDIYDYHIHFFYRPKQYTLTLMFDNAEERREESYYYGQSLAKTIAYEGYTEPSKEGYYFAGWYLNKEGLGEPFDFASEVMPNSAVVLYPVLKVLEYTVKIDPNGGVIDHAANDSMSTYFNAKYGTPVGEYTIIRDYIKLSSKEQDEHDTIYYDPAAHPWYYYVNVQRLGPNHDGTPGPDGDWGYPADVRSAVYLTETELAAFYNNYCDVVRSADPEWWTNIQALSLQEFKDAFCDYPYRPVDGERYTFMGWYQVRNGVVDTMPYNFNDPVTGDLELRAKWRLEGGYFLQYNPYYLTNEGELIVGELSQWTDPINPSEQLYADQSLTHILRAPTQETVSEGYVFRGWHIVKKSDLPPVHNDANGKDYYYWEAIEKDENGKIIYYQPGDPFIVDSKYVTEVQSGRTGSIIHLQAYYEPEDVSSRRPERANLTLDATDGFITYENGTELQENKSLDKLGAVGTVVLDVSNNKEQIVFGNIQSNISVPLMEYADIPNYFKHPLGFFLLGFDEAPDVDYVAKYPADAVIAVQRTDEKTLYAVWEKMVYVTFVNDTKQPITVSIEGTGNTTASIVNKSTGKFDRESITKVFEVPANSDVKIVLPGADTDLDDSFTATVTNTHYRKKMRVSGSFQGSFYGEASDPVYYGGDLTYTGVLQIDEDGIIVTYKEDDVPEVLFDVNGGTWTSQPAPDYYQKRTDNLYALPFDNIQDNQYRPTNDPTHANKIFVGWTANADIAAQTDFSASGTVKWGDTEITPAEGSNVLDEVINHYLWNFDITAPTDEGTNILYAVWSDKVTVIFDLTMTGTKLHNWTGPTTTETPGNYVFYRTPGNSLSPTVTYTLMRGEKLPVIPDDPTCNREKQWSFLNWLRVDLYENTTKGRSTVSQYAFDFNTPINYNTPLYTSWTAKTNIQTYEFTIQNNVPAPGDQEKDFTYTITAEEVERRSGNSYVNPDILFGSVSTQLKHGETYTVRITITKDPDNSMHDVYAEVIDRTNSVIKQGHLLTYQNSNSASEYKYTIHVTQNPEEGYCTNVSTDTAGTNILTMLHDQFTFFSSTGSHYNPTTNPFSSANDRNKNATVIFTNWRKEDLTLTKHVEYDMGDRNRDFTFTLVSVEGDTGGTAEYKYSKTGDSSSPEEGWLRIGDTFTLKHGKSITIDIPHNKAAVISEDNTNYSTGWSTSNTTAALNDDGSAAATITLTGAADITVTNTRGTQEVTVKKLVDTENTSQAFNFTAKLSDGSVPIANYTVYADNENNSNTIETDSAGNAVFSLHHNETQTLTIPYGAKLVVTETITLGYSPSVEMVDSNNQTIPNDVEGTASFTQNRVTQDGTIIFTNTEDVRRVLLFDTNNGTWTDSSGKFETLSDTLYQIPEENISGNDYRPADPTWNGKIFIGWTEYEDIAKIINTGSAEPRTDFSSISPVTFGSIDITPDADGIVLDKIRSNYLWDFSRPPEDEDYGKTLYAIWSEAVTVTYNIIYSSKLNANPLKCHTWNDANPVETGTPYKQYYSTEPGYINYTVAKGERIPKPIDPSPNSGIESAIFAKWLVWVTGFAKDSYRYSPKGADDSVFNPKSSDPNYMYDFSTRITESVTLCTSWINEKPQVFTFTVVNQVISGNANDEFEYTIEVVDDYVYGKLLSGKKRDHPDESWGSVTTSLKNDQEYKIVVSVSRRREYGGDYNVEIEVFDKDNVSIKQGHVVCCKNATYWHFASNVEYILQITQSEAAGYSTVVNIDDVVGISNANNGTASGYSSNDESRWFKFYSCMSRPNEPNGFPADVNGYAENDDPNSLTVIFTNTGSEQPLPAPTSYTSRHTPWLLLLLFGLILLCGGIGIRGERNQEKAEEEPVISKEILDTGPPGRKSSQDGPQKGMAFPDTGQKIRKLIRDHINGHSYRKTKDQTEEIPETGQKETEDLEKERKMKGVLHPMKKKGIAILAIMLMFALIGSAAFADSAKTDGTVNTYKGIDSSENTIGIAKQIVFINAENTAIREPNITYTYTIAPASVGTSVTVTDHDGNSGNVNAGVAAAVTGAATSTTSTVAFADTATVSATANGTASAAKYAEFTFDPSKFKVNNVLTPGIYRYSITETCSPTKDSVGITSPAGYNTGRFLDVYVKWNDARTALEIYGYVLFEGSATDSIASTDVTMKSTGYVNTSTTAGQQADVDVYETQNLYIHKITTGALAQKSNNFPITLTLTAPSGVDAPKMDVTVSGNGTLTNTSGYISAWGDVTGTVQDGSEITVKGIPTSAKASVVERNNTTDSYKVKAGTTSGAADLLTEAIIAAGASTNATSDVIINAKKDIFLTNTLDTISPTGYVVRFAPYALMLIGGIVLLIIAKKHKRHTDEE